MRLRLCGATVAALLVTLAVEALPAMAQDALICRKRDHLADRSGKTYRLGRGNDYFNAGPGPDTILGGPGNDIINGGRGDDVVRGGPGRDIVCGGIGRDRAFGDTGADEVYGEEGDDRSTGGPGKDYVNGQAGKDVVIGFGRHRGRIVADGRDFLDGSYRPDVLLLGGKDVAFGGIDEDVLRVKTTRVGARRMDGGDQGDLLIGNNADDLMLGGNGDNTLRGRGGNDTLIGGGAIDVAHGGPGDDVVDGGESGNDDLFGDSGDDLCVGIYRVLFDSTCERKRNVDHSKSGTIPTSPAAPFTGATPIASVAGSCQDRLPGEWTIANPPARQEALVRISSTGRQNSINAYPFFRAGLIGRDTGWFRSSGIPDRGFFNCTYAGDYTIDFYDPPLAPVTFPGAGLPDYHDSSQLLFRVPAAGGYVADVALEQGAVRVAGRANLAEYSGSGGTFPLGQLAPGITHSLSVENRAGDVQSRWNVTIRPAP